MSSWWYGQILSKRFFWHFFMNIWNWSDMISCPTDTHIFTQWKSQAKITMMISTDDETLMSLSLCVVITYWFSRLPSQHYEHYYQHTAHPISGTDWVHKKCKGFAQAHPSISFCMSTLMYRSSQTCVETWPNDWTHDVTFFSVIDHRRTCVTIGVMDRYVLWSCSQHRVTRDWTNFKMKSIGIISTSWKIT